MYICIYVYIYVRACEHSRVVDMMKMNPRPVPLRYVSPCGSITRKGILLYASNYAIWQGNDAAGSAPGDR